MKVFRCIWCDIRKPLLNVFLTKKNHGYKLTFNLVFIAHLHLQIELMSKMLVVTINKVTLSMIWFRRSWTTSCWIEQCPVFWIMVKSKTFINRLNVLRLTMTMINMYWTLINIFLKPLQQINTYKKPQSPSFCGASLKLNKLVFLNQNM